MTNAADRRRLRRAGRPLRARRRGVLPRDRLPHRGQGGARGLGVGRRAGARGPRHRAAGDRQDARGEARTRSTRPATSPPRRSCARKFPAGLISVMHLPGFGPKRARRLYDELGDRLARRAARGGRGSGRSASCAASAPRSRRSCSSTLADHERRRRARRRGSCSRARCRSPSRSSARCASIPARRARRGRRLAAAAGPTPSRTSTSSPPRRPRGAGRRRCASWTLVESVAVVGRRRRARDDALRA